MAGFPAARMAWRVLAEQGDDALLALLTLLAEVADTNLLHRGGPEGPAEARRAGLEELDNACIARNLSPGGCADLLALALLLRRTEGIWHG